MFRFCSMIHVLNNYTFILLCTIHHMEFYRTDPTYMYTIISKNLPTKPIPSMKSMLRSGTELADFGYFRQCCTEFYLVRCGAYI